MCDTIIYDLSDKSCNINDLWENIFKNIEKKEKLFEYKNIIGKRIETNNDIYYVLNYDKRIITNDSFNTLGLFRSVVIRDKEIVSFSPPRSMNYYDFLKSNKELNENIIVEEFIEGTMINLFFDKKINNGNGDWQIATKSSVGGYYSSPSSNNDENNMTFRQMFVDAMNAVNIEFDMFDKNYVYSFVLRHPKNKIVSMVTNPLIILTSIFKIDNTNYTINSISLHSFGSNDDKMKPFIDNIIVPKRNRNIKTYEEVKEKYSSMNTDYNIMGVIIKNKITGERTKIRNPNYENVKNIKGNSPKLQYKYLSLRKIGKVKEYLRYFSEDRSRFSSFRDYLHQYTNALYNNYVNCYIKKVKNINNYPSNFKNHMINLHDYYLNHLMPVKKYISYKSVVSYVNNLHPSQQMFVLNYNIRKKNTEENKYYKIKEILEKKI